MNDLKEIEKHARAKHVPIMKEEGITFLQSFIMEHPELMRKLEAGTAVGYSAIAMASVRENIMVDTLEINKKMISIAKQNIEDAGMKDRVFVHEMDAMLYQSAQYYDLFFIDAAKSQYYKYLDHFMPMSYVGSYFVFDNMNFHGIVEDPELSHNRSTLQMTRKLKKFREQILQDERFEHAFYPEIGDGILVLKRIK